MGEWKRLFMQLWGIAARSGARAIGIIWGKRSVEGNGGGDGETD